MNMIPSIGLGLALMWSVPAFATDIDRTPPEGGQVILAAGEGLPITELLELEPAHLLALGTGIVVGAVTIGPYLGIGEIVGVAVGVISAELFYRSDLWPFERTEGWF